MNKKFQKKLNDLGKLSGYQKPTKVDDVLKLDSNENLAIKKEFQTELIREAQKRADIRTCLLYTSPSPRDQRGSRMPSSA